MNSFEASFPLVIALGSNLGDRLANIDQATSELEKIFDLIASSYVYQSSAVDYTQQPYFYNQLLEFKLPAISQMDILNKALEIEILMGRERTMPKGPRNIDIDLIFAGKMPYQNDKLILPHPRWLQRSFIVIPLKELPVYETVSTMYDIPQSFSAEMSLKMIR